jgi:hypothetical protein
VPPSSPLERRNRKASDLPLDCLDSPSCVQISNAKTPASVQFQKQKLRARTSSSKVEWTYRKNTDSPAIRKTQANAHAPLSFLGLK